MASRLKDRGGGGGKVAASRPLTPKPYSSAATASARRTPTASGKENSAGKPSRPPITSAVRWSTSSLPRASRVGNPSDSSKLISALRSAAPPRISGGKDLEAAAALRRSVSGGIMAASEKGRRSVGGVVGRLSDARKGGNAVGLDEISRKREGFDAKVKLVHEIDRKREGPGAKAKHIDEVSKKRGSLDAKAKQMDGIGRKKEGFDVSALKQSDEIGRKREGSDGKTKASDEVGAKKEEIDVKVVKEINSKKPVGVPGSGETSSKATTFSTLNGPGVKKGDEGSDHCIIPVFTVHVMDSKDDMDGAREHQRKNDECKQQEDRGKLAEKIRVFEKAAASEVGRPMRAVCGVNKYPSKLHEKLVALEGRVQKIASEIKKTKEMLDENNPDEPKLILANIQKEITAVEKEISHVKDDNKIRLGTVDSGDTKSLQAKKTEKCAAVKLGDAKHPAKGLNGDELEARFFPHHKLLRDRRSSNATQQELSAASKKDSNAKMETAAINPHDDENSIAMEFLASLDGEESDFFKDRRARKLEKSKIREATDGSSKTSEQCSSKNPVGGEYKKDEVELLATEKIEDFDEQENKSSLAVQEETEESSDDQLSGIGNKSSTGGWFVSEGEAVLLAHGDGTCSYYDILNSEFKSEYKPPRGVSHNIWGDCWLIRAPGVDGCSGRYVVAASAGDSLESGFCCWDYYSRGVKAFHIEEETSHALSVPSRTILGLLPNVGSSRTSSAMPTVERRQWWYRPCGPLLLSTASKQKMVTAYDIRDGEVAMKWEVNNLVAGMEYSSPLQWRSRGKVVIAGTESIGLWDVNSLNPQPSISVCSAGKRIYCLYVNNTDAEVGGGVRQRVSASEVEGNDGVFSTQESVNVFDFRLPAGVGLKISRNGGTANSIYSRGDSVFIGSTDARLQMKGGARSRVQQYSLRKGKLVATYELPEFNADFHHSSITQVWGNSNIVMAACGMGLFVFDAFKEDGQQTYSFDRGNAIGVREAIGPDDLYLPTFDYLSSRVLLVSRDRPAHWRYLR